MHTVHLLLLCMAAYLAVTSGLIANGWSSILLTLGRYGRSLHIWDWEEHKVIQDIDLGEEGMIPLELRFLHNPDEAQGYVGAALSSNVFHFCKTEVYVAIGQVICLGSSIVLVATEFSFSFYILLSCVLSCVWVCLLFQQNALWKAEKVIDVPSKKVEGWALPHMPGTQCVLTAFYFTYS